MERRTKLIILVVIAVVVMLGLVLLALAPRPVATPQPQPTPPSSAIPVVGGSPLPGESPAVAVQPSPVTKEPATQTTLQAFAVTFAERYGSYSTDGTLENLRQLKPLMTAEGFAHAEQKLRSSLPTNSFYGVTTRALSAQIIALDEQETEAQLVVQTQRSETRTGLTAQQFYQPLSVTVVKTQNGWRVKLAEWQ